MKYCVSVIAASNVAALILVTACSGGATSPSPAPTSSGASNTSIAPTSSTSPTVGGSSAVPTATPSSSAPSTGCQLPFNTGSTQCNVCLQTSCCLQFDACEKDPACHALDVCVGNCDRTSQTQEQYDSCTQQCETNNANGTQTFEAAEGCAHSFCATQCGAPPGQ